MLHHRTDEAWRAKSRQVGMVVDPDVAPSSSAILIALRWAFAAATIVVALAYALQALGLVEAA
ncbi:hypothetical protein [Methylobacterium sp. WSM2598]|uniref:hypothetical protein n=1 Tax=Methylobacterium sp. WSM2598 TaxID=398261 RepID=UPI00035D823B|nr:hypothetical protein [Methylobacterium sp. WSM2598]